MTADDRSRRVAAPRAWLLALGLAVAGMLAGGLLVAQPAAPSASGALRARAAKLRQRLLREKVGLDAHKAEQVAAIIDEQRDEQRRLRRDMRAARQELRRLFADDSSDDQAYEAALAKLRASYRGLADLRDRQFDAIKKVLTPREQAKLLAALARAHKELAARGRGKGKGNGKGQGKDKPRRRRQ
jgi:Spy/CpxP family protein refolding chaperone